MLQISPALDRKCVNFLILCYNKPGLNLKYFRARGFSCRKGTVSMILKRNKKKNREKKLTHSGTIFELPKTSDI